MSLNVVGCGLLYGESDQLGLYPCSPWGHGSDWRSMKCPLEPWGEPVGPWNTWVMCDGLFMDQEGTHWTSWNTPDLLIVLDVSWLGGPRRSVHGRSSSRLTRQVDQVHDDTHDLSLNGGRLLHAWTDKKPMMLGFFMFGDPSGCWELLVKVRVPVCKIHVLGLWMLF